MIILHSKEACPLLWREALSLTSKAIHCINILKRIVKTKIASVSALLIAGKRPVQNYLPTIKKAYEMIKLK